MSDPLADMLIEHAAAEEGEREGQRILMERITELLQAIRGLQASMELLLKMERAEQMERTLTVTERDEFDRITKIRIH